MYQIIKELCTIDKIVFSIDYFLVASLFSIISSLCVIILDLILKQYDIKFLKTNLKNWDYIFWVIGSLITYHLLYFLKIVPFNIQSIIIVSFIWTKLILDNYNSLTKKNLNKEKDLLVETEEEIK